MKCRLPFRILKTPRGIQGLRLLRELRPLLQPQTPHGLLLIFDSGLPEEAFWNTLHAHILILFVFIDPIF